MHHSSICQSLTTCLACGASQDHLHSVLDLGEQPLANALLDSPDQKFSVFPLALNHCDRCGHGQLTHAVNPSILYNNYVYASGTSATLGRYFDWFADDCHDTFSPGAAVLELACNDCSLLRRLDDRGFFTFGIDPALNLLPVQGVRTSAAMWPCSLPVGPYSHYDIVIAMNVLAHGPNPLAFLEGIRDALSHNGVAIIQTSQGKMLESGQMDTLYHEHHSFFTVGSMAWLASRAGLRLRDVKEVSVHGNSPVFILDLPSNDQPGDLTGFLESGEFATSYQPPLSGSNADYYRFATNAEITINHVRNTVNQYRKQGWSVAFIGAAAKAIVFMHACKLIPDIIYDEAPLKIGKWLPGLNIQIKPLAHIGNEPFPMLAVIGAWNFATELAEKVRGIRGANAKETRFLTYFPSIEEFY